MGVESVNSPEVWALARQAVAPATAASRPRDVRPAEATPAQERAGPGSGEERAQRVEEQVVQDLSPVRVGTRLRVDNASKRVVAQIMDASNQVIKQIPPEELLKIMANVRRMLGVMFDIKA